jgi:hypothetical protein
MNFYTKAEVWLDKAALPNTTKKAKPGKLQKVSGPTITVVDAYYRGSTFSGTFLLAEEVTTSEKTKRRVKVYCRWFGHRLKKGEPSFLIDLKTAKLQHGGEVLTDFVF